MKKGVFLIFVLPSQIFLASLSLGWVRKKFRAVLANQKSRLILAKLTGGRVCRSLVRVVNSFLIL